ncbi:uncharacterized protein A4U43_C08F15350 [Asparagus officinalis]|nr:uncharacterized protein A4U43_C08F15350 [Asparagus officinalis]
MADTKKRCLYEILNVSRDCSQEEVRSAYRRLALQLHPDKNPNASSAAFQDLQHAYEVLSDPRERQFYDSHRSQILFSNPTSSKPTSSFFDLDLFSFFSTSAFSGFGHTGKGFFKVYGDVFGKIYDQELFFVKELGLDEDLVRPAPLIGDLESPYSQVTAFYSYWLGFCTVLDFGWVDEYDTSLGVNRRSRRAMEEENKKKRKKARREYNDLVRDLAAFVKKRDKRVRDMQVKRSLEEEKRREEEKKRREEEERRKMERARMYKEQEWAKIDDEEETVIFYEMMGAAENDDKGKKKEEFYCVVCNKKFKSDKQWKNHEQSKKHRERVAELKVSFQEEEEEEEEVGFGSVCVGEDQETDCGNVVYELTEEFKEDLDLEEGEVQDGDSEDEALGSDDEESILEAMVSGRTCNKGPHLDRDDSLSNPSDYLNHNEEIFTGSGSWKGRKHRPARRRSEAYGNGEELLKEETSENKTGEIDHQDQEDVEEPKEGEILTEGGNAKEQTEETSLSEGVVAKGNGNRATGKKNKKQQVDARGPSKKDAKVSKSSSKGKKQKASTKAPSNACDMCGENFDTRNKLFAHLGATGHATLKSR